jgi:hypothetical protein
MRTRSAATWRPTARDWPTASSSAAEDAENTATITEPRAVVQANVAIWPTGRGARCVMLDGEDWSRAFGDES